MLNHTWSLAIEEQFYLVWPLVLFLLLRARLTMRTLMAVVVGGILVSGALVVVEDSRGAVAQSVRAFYGTDTRAQALLIGVFVALVAFGGLLPDTRPRIRIARVASLLGAALVVLMLVVQQRNGRFLFRGGFTVIAVAVAVVLVGVLVSPLGPLGATLRFRPLRWVGEISYGLYLVHWPVAYAMRGERLGLTRWQAIGVYTAVSIAIAATSFYLVERPILRLKRRVERAEGGRRHGPLVDGSDDMTPAEPSIAAAGAG
jgi:peptidoglycan/LPS O-acetylase OafA/YrhL